LTAPRSARFASRLLVRATASLPPPPPREDAREQAIEALAAAIAARASRRRALRWALASVAAATIIANAVGISHFSARRSLATTSKTPAPAAAAGEILAHPGAGAASAGGAGSPRPPGHEGAIGEASPLVS